MGDRNNNVGSGGGADRRANRRRFLKGVGALGMAGAAGCLGGGDGSTDTPTDTDGETPTEGETPTDGATPTDEETSTDTETDTQTETPTPSEPANNAILVVSITKGFRHGSIPAGNDALESIVEEIASDMGVDDFTLDIVDANPDVGETEYPEDLQSQLPSSLEEFQAYDCVVFQNTTGEIFEPEEQQPAFQQYIQNGGGWIGIHAGADTHEEWPWFEDMAGAWFAGHPDVQEAEIHVTDRTHPSTSHLPARWTRTDEWYDYSRNPRGNVHVLATLDERTYDDAGMDDQWGRDHPIAWCQNVANGRSFYTGGGHTSDAFGEDDFVQHLKGGLMWAAGYVDGEANGTVWDSFAEETIVEGASGPMKMDVSEDGRLFYTERDGSLNMVDLDTTEESTLVSLDVYTDQEDGLQGVALDPEFTDNGYLYVYYSPSEVPEDAADQVGDNHLGSDYGVNRISRFTVEGGSIDAGTEQQFLDVVTQRNTCCHTGGDLEFDSEANLYLTTGDDTNPFESSGYTPIDERDGREPWDGQRSSANTDDLRGSVVRISPNDDGGYEIPEGNLRSVTDGPDDQVRPELYAIGFRNPFTAAVDPATDTLYLADYGPDSGGWNADRGPMGTTEYAQVDEPGFYGWPYFTGHSVPYKHYDFDTGESGRIFDPENPTNDSVNNSGLEELPPAQGSFVMSPYNWGGYIDYPDEWEEYVPYSSVDEVPFPQVTGGAPMIGTVFRDREGYGDAALSTSYDGKVFMMEYGGNWVKYATLDDDGEVMEVDPFMPDRGFSSPFDMSVGPDGALYLMERGSGSITRFTVDADAITGDLSLSLSGIGGRATPGSSATLTAELNNTASVPAENVAVGIESSSDDLDVSAGSGTSPGTIDAGDSATAEWDVSVPDSASGGYDLTVTVTYTLDGEDQELVETSSFVVTDGVSGLFGLNCGGTETDGTVTIDGLTFDNEPGPNVTVTGDPSAYVTEDTEVDNTDNDLLYRTELFGGDIGFDIAVEDGTYDVILHFAEIFWEESGQRIFDVSVQGETLVEDFDIYEEAGHDVAVTKVASGVEVDGGPLTIASSTAVNNTKFSGIEIRES
jgi:glucose/arabinose dehydrogenase/type 1 glutamine amidotransferase